jgi:hypothetical protein
MISPTVTTPDPRERDMNKLKSIGMSESFHVNLISNHLNDSIALEKKAFRQGLKLTFSRTSPYGLVLQEIY